MGGAITCSVVFRSFGRRFFKVEFRFWRRISSRFGGVRIIERRVGVRFGIRLLFSLRLSVVFDFKYVYDEVVFRIGRGVIVFLSYFGSLGLCWLS